MARRIEVQARTILLVEKAWLSGSAWTLQNPIDTLANVSEAISELFVYAQLTGGLGTYDFRIQIRAFTSEFALGESNSSRHEFGENRSIPVEVVFRLANIEFPRSDLYEFQLIANHRPVENGVYFLSVETPEPNWEES